MAKTMEKSNGRRRRTIKTTDGEAEQTMGKTSFPLSLPSLVRLLRWLASPFVFAVFWSVVVISHTRSRVRKFQLPVTHSDLRCAMVSCGTCLLYETNNDAYMSDRQWREG